MKKTLLIIVAALSTSLAFGQSATIKGNASPLKVSTSSAETIVISDISAKGFKANSLSKQTNTKAPGDKIVDWRFTPSFFSSLKFGQDSSGYTEDNWKYGCFAWADVFTLPGLENAKTYDSLGNVVGVDKSATYNWFTANLQADIKSLSDANGGGCLMMTSIDTAAALGDPFINSWVEFPSFHVGNSPAIVEIINFFFKYGNENYLITYSINNGTSWDSIVFNYLSPSMDIITQHFTRTSVGLPEKCKNQDVIIRLNLVGRQSTWVIPSITVCEAKNYDMHINYQQYADNAYHKIPVGLKAAPLYWSASISNYGSEQMYDVQGLVSIKDNSNNEIEVSTSTIIDTLRSVKDTILYITPGHTIARYGYDTTDITFVNIPVDSIAEYTVNQSIVYKTGTADSVYSFDERNPIYVNVNYDYNDSVNRGIWARDNGVTCNDYYWRIGYLANGTTLDPNYNVGKQDYKLLVGYNTDKEYDDTEEPLYIVGVQMVLDPGSRPGTYVSSFIYLFDSTSVDSKDTNLLNYHFTTIEGESHPLHENAIAQFNDPTKLYYDGEYNVLELPVKEAIQLEKGRTYYAGYKLDDELPFYVSRNYSQHVKEPNSIPFRVGTGAERGTVLLYTPEAKKLGFYPYAADVPMIRLIVSNDPDNLPIPEVGIKTPKEVNFNLNAYPNPASDYVNIAYTIDNSTKVTIEIYDIFGRLVKVQESKAIAGERKTEQINVSNLASGTYIYTLNVDGVKQSKKFIVTK